jgi:hypothetical protein
MPATTALLEKISFAESYHLPLVTVEYYTAALSAHVLGRHGCQSANQYSQPGSQVG